MVDYALLQKHKGMIFCFVFFFPEKGSSVINIKTKQENSMSGSGGGGSMDLVSKNPQKF